MYTTWIYGQLPGRKLQPERCREMQDTSEDLGRCDDWSIGTKDTDLTLGSKLYAWHWSSLVASSCCIVRPLVMQWYLGCMRRRRWLGPEQESILSVPIKFGYGKPGGGGKTRKGASDAQVGAAAGILFKNNYLIVTVTNKSNAIIV